MIALLTGCEKSELPANPAANPLLARPSTVPHPSGELAQTTALLPVGSTGYNQIATWITRGCPTQQ